MNYKNKKCLICEQLFGDDEEITACPECGTPYHKKCYLEKNNCINYALHSSGKSWYENEKEKEKTEAIIKKLKEKSEADANEKKRNAENVSSENESPVTIITLDSQDEYFGMNPDESMDEESQITLGDMADYAGRNKLYYMLTFRRLKDAAIKFSLNLVAFLFPEYFFGIRKMYFLAFIVAVFRLVLQIPSDFEMILQFEGQGEMFGSGMYGPLVDFVSTHRFSARVVNLTTALDLAFKVVFGLTANQLYYMHTVRKIKKIKKTSGGDYKETIKKSGGVSYISILGVFLVETLIVCVFLMILMVAAYF